MIGVGHRPQLKGNKDPASLGTKPNITKLYSLRNVLPSWPLMRIVKCDDIHVGVME